MTLRCMDGHFSQSYKLLQIHLFSHETKAWGVSCVSEHPAAGHLRERAAGTLASLASLRDGEAPLGKRSSQGSPLSGLRLNPGVMLAWQFPA